MHLDFVRFLTLISARTAIILVFLIAGLRWLGKRQIGQMNLYDLALIMALANAVQNAMTGGKGHLSVGIVSSGTLLLMGWLLSVVFVRLPKLETRLVGTATLLINDGAVVSEHLRREHCTLAELNAAIRQHGLTDVGEVLMAVLEVDGTISIVPKTAPHKRIRGPKAARGQKGGDKPRL